MVCVSKDPLANSTDMQFGNKDTKIDFKNREDNCL